MSTKDQKEKQKEQQEIFDDAKEKIVDRHFNQYITSAGKNGITLDDIYNTNVKGLNNKTLADIHYPKDKLKEKIEGHVTWGIFKKRDDRYYNE